MAGGYTVVNPNELERMAEELIRLQRRIAELERPTGSQITESIDRLNETDADILATIDRLNNAVFTSDATSGLLDQTTAPNPSTNYDAATVNFARPAWATRATVLANGFVFAGGTFNSPTGLTARLRIDGVNGPSVNFTGPIYADVYSGGIPTGDQAAVNQNTRTLFFARTFDTAAASISISNRLDIGLLGAGSGLQATVGATVFWSAP